MMKKETLYATSRPISRTDLARHFAVSPHSVDGCIAKVGCRSLPGNRYEMTDVWRRMWGIDKVPMELISEMGARLITVEQIAETMDVTAHTIRRAGNSNDPFWNLPEHFDFGPRLRRYLPLHVEAWLKRAPIETWLKRRSGRMTSQGLVLKQPKDRQEGKRTN